MLRSVKELYNYVLQAEDGEIGRSKDFLFDDRFWAIRYMVADTGKWIPGRPVKTRRMIDLLNTAGIAVSMDEKQ